MITLQMVCNGVESLGSFIQVIFFSGITLIGDEESLTLNEAASLEMLSDEELVVEIFDLKDEGKFMKRFLNETEN